MPGDGPVLGVVLAHGAGRGSRESLLEMGRALASAGTAVIIVAAVINMTAEMPPPLPF